MKHLIFLIALFFSGCHIHYHIESTPKEIEIEKFVEVYATEEVPYKPNYRFNPMFNGVCDVPGCAVLHSGIILDLPRTTDRYKPDTEFPGLIFPNKIKISKK